MATREAKGKSSPEAILNWFQNLYCIAKKGTAEDFKKAIIEWHNDHPKEYKTTDDELRQELYDYAKGKVNKKLNEKDYRFMFIKAIKEEATFMKFLEKKCQGAMRPLQKGTIRAALTNKKNKEIKENNNMSFEDRLWESIEELVEAPVADVVAAKGGLKPGAYQQAQDTVVNQVHTGESDIRGELIGQNGKLVVSSLYVNNKKVSPREFYQGNKETGALITALINKIEAKQIQDPLLKKMLDASDFAVDNEKTLDFAYKGDRTFNVTADTGRGNAVKVTV
jgi:hypothetical protein